MINADKLISQRQQKSHQENLDFFFLLLFEGGNTAIHINTHYTIILDLKRRDRWDF